MIVTTTPSVDGKQISGYLGIVTGEAILGANIFKDIFASITDIVGGRAGRYEQEIGKARKISLDEMIQEATGLGADAIVGVDLDYEVIRDSMLMVTSSGTAVKLG